MKISDRHTLFYIINQKGAFHMAAIEMNSELFRTMVQEGDRPVLVDYWAPWCVYCRRIAPAVEKLAGELADLVTIAKVNIDDEPKLAQAEQIEVIPTLVLYQGGKVLGSIVAPESKAKIEAFVREHLDR